MHVVLYEMSYDGIAGESMKRSKLNSSSKFILRFFSPWIDMYIGIFFTQHKTLGGIVVNVISSLISDRSTIAEIGWCPLILLCGPIISLVDGTKTHYFSSVTDFTNEEHSGFSLVVNVLESTVSLRTLYSQIWI